jgi:hypothetical protein
MRSAEELQVELVRTRRRLHRVTGVMTFVFIAGVAVVFAAVGGALVVVDKRAAQTLQPAPSSRPHQAATTGSAPAGSAAPQPPAATTAARAPTKQPSPASAVRAISADAGTIAGASAGARTRAAVAPANPAPQPAQTHPQSHAPSNEITTTASVNPTQPSPQPKHQAQQQPAGSGRGAIHAVQPAAAAAAPPAPAARPSQPIDAKHTARKRSSRERKTAKNTRSDEADADNPRDDNSRHDARAAVGAAPSDTGMRAEDARARRHGYVRARPDDEEAADARGPQRVIVLGPRQRYAPRPDERDDDEGEPPRQHGGPFGGVLSGIFGPPDR